MIPDPKLMTLRKVRRYAIPAIFDPTPTKLRELGDVLAEYDAIPGDPAPTEELPDLLKIWEATIQYHDDPSHSNQAHLSALIGEWTETWEKKRGRY